MTDRSAFVRLAQLVVMLLIMLIGVNFIGGLLLLKKSEEIEKRLRIAPSDVAEKVEEVNRDVVSDRWRKADMEAWVQELREDNATLDIPDLEAR